MQECFAKTTFTNHGDLCGGYYTETLKFKGQNQIQTSLFKPWKERIWSYFWLLGLELWYDLYANFWLWCIDRIFQAIFTMMWMLPNICSSLKEPKCLEGRSSFLYLRQTDRYYREGLLPSFDVMLSFIVTARPVWMSYENRRQICLVGMVRVWVKQEGLWKKGAGAFRKVIWSHHNSQMALNRHLLEHTFHYLHSLLSSVFQCQKNNYFPFHNTLLQKCYEGNEKIWEKGPALLGTERLFWNKGFNVGFNNMKNIWRTK